jgi:hypothetical protein
MERMYLVEDFTISTDQYSYESGANLYWKCYVLPVLPPIYYCTPPFVLENSLYGRIQLTFVEFSYSYSSSFPSNSKPNIDTLKKAFLAYSYKPIRSSEQPLFILYGL